MAYPIPIRIRASQQDGTRIPDQVRNRTYRIDRDYDMGSRTSSPLQPPSRSTLI
jgi:hypothetical protein